MSQLVQNQPVGDDFERGRNTNPNQSEIIRQSLYDFVLYPTAGQVLLAMFSQPIGQGVTTAIGGTVGTAKTRWDTNLQLANTLPSGKALMVQSIEVFFFPGSVSTANTYTPATPAQFAAVAAAALLLQNNDVNQFYQSGGLEFNVLDKNYVFETPLSQFPPQTSIGQDAAVSSNSATTAEVASTFARALGRPYVFLMPFSLLPAQNFAVNLIWPAAVATPSGFNARVGVKLDGFTQRASQ
jgi:cell wall-associated NlpC family hydrolase